MAKETGQEKVQDIKASGKGAGDVPAAAAAGEEQLVIRAPVHCDGCGRKLRRSLQRLEGVGEVTVDSRTNTVVVRGRTAVENAMEVVQVVERRTGEKAVLVSPLPEKLPPHSSAPKGGETNDKKNDANTKDMGNDLPEVDMEMVNVLKINLHCDACSEEIKRRILKITGVEEAVPHLKSSQVMVKGKVEPATLVGFIHKCTGRRGAIVRAEPLDDLLQSAKSPAPPVEAESKNGGRQNGKKKEEPNEENKGGGGDEDNNVDDEDPETEKPSDGGHGATAEEHGAHAGEAPNHNNGDHADREDEIRWRWTNNGEYTTKSAYRVQFEGTYGKLKLMPIWRVAAEPKCRFFAWTLLHKKILTANNLLRRNWSNDPICKLCDTEPETPLHLCKDCQYSKQVWSFFKQWLDLSVIDAVLVRGSLHGYWRRCRAKVEKEQKKKFDGIMIYFWWNIWKERNRRIFQQKSLQPCQVALLCKDDIQQYQLATRTTAQGEEQ